MGFDLPDNAVYQVDSFGCSLSTRKKFTEELQQLIDKRASEGWKLHSFNVIMGDVCVAVFYKQRY